MNRYSILHGMAVLAILLTAVAGLTYAQGPEPQGVQSPQAPLGTAFTYQGRLLDGGVPADNPNGYDFEFTLYDDPSAGSVVAGPLNFNDHQVDYGLFTVTLDFGSDVFTGDARWMRIGVRPWDSTGAYTYLDPRQELTPTPHALYAIQTRVQGAR